MKLDFGSGRAKLSAVSRFMVSEDTTLKEALAQHSIELEAGQVQRLDAYCQLLWDWNSKLNLTRHTTYELFVARDLVDSLQLSELIPTHERVLDVGSGGGVPGIVLAILRPDLSISLCESVQKKAVVLSAMVKELGLDVAVVAGRAEKSLANVRYDTLVTRAVGPLWKMLKWFEDSWGSFGRLLAVKGPRWVDERGEARHRGYMRALDLRRVASYPLAGTDSLSVILEIKRKSA